MKTKTTNATKSTHAICKRNFFQKTFVLLAILAFTGFSFNATAQKIKLNVVNNSSCTITFELFNSSLTSIYGPYNITSGNSNNTYNCQDLSNVYEIKITDNCSNTVTFDSPSGFADTLGLVCPGCSSIAVCTQTTTFSCGFAPLTTEEVVITIN